MTALQTWLAERMQSADVTREVIPIFGDHHHYAGSMSTGGKVTPMKVTSVTKPATPKPAGVKTASSKPKATDYKAGARALQRKATKLAREAKEARAAGQHRVADMLDKHAKEHRQIAKQILADHAGEAGAQRVTSLSDYVTQRLQRANVTRDHIPVFDDKHHYAGSLPGTGAQYEPTKATKATAPKGVTKAQGAKAGKSTLVQQSMAPQTSDHMHLSGVHSVPISLLLDNTVNPRGIDMEHAKALAESIKLNGQATPIDVMPRYDANGKMVGYSVVAGGHRMTALQLLQTEAEKSGSAPVNALINVTHRTPAEAETAALMENLARKDMAPLDTARALAREVTKQNGDVSKVAAIFGQKPEFVQRHLDMLTLPEPIQRLVNNDVIKINSALFPLVVELHQSVDTKTFNTTMDSIIQANGAGKQTMISARDAGIALKRALNDAHQVSMFTTSDETSGDVAKVRGRHTALMDKIKAALSSFADPKKRSETALAVARMPSHQREVAKEEVRQTIKEMQRYLREIEQHEATVRAVMPTEQNSVTKDDVQKAIQAMRQYLYEIEQHEAPAQRTTLATWLATRLAMPAGERHDTQSTPITLRNWLTTRLA